MLLTSTRRARRTRATRVCLGAQPCWEKAVKQNVELWSMNKEADTAGLTIIREWGRKILKIKYVFSEQKMFHV